MLNKKLTILFLYSFIISSPLKSISPQHTKKISKILFFHHNNYSNQSPLSFPLYTSIFSKSNQTTKVSQLVEYNIFLPKEMIVDIIKKLLPPSLNISSHFLSLENIQIEDDLTLSIEEKVSPHQTKDDFINKTLLPLLRTYKDLHTSNLETQKNSQHSTFLKSAYFILKLPPQNLENTKKIETLKKMITKLSHQLKFSSFIQTLLPQRRLIFQSLLKRFPFLNKLPYSHLSFLINHDPSKNLEAVKKTLVFIEEILLMNDLKLQRDLKLIFPALSPILKEHFSLNKFILSKIFFHPYFYSDFCHLLKKHPLSPINKEKRNTKIKNSANYSILHNIPRIYIQMILDRIHNFKDDQEEFEFIINLFMKKVDRFKEMSHDLHLLSDFIIDILYDESYTTEFYFLLNTLLSPDLKEAFEPLITLFLLSKKNDNDLNFKKLILFLSKKLQKKHLSLFPHITELPALNPLEENEWNQNFSSSFPKVNALNYLGNSSIIILKRA